MDMKRVKLVLNLNFELLRNQKEFLVEILCEDERAESVIGLIEAIQEQCFDNPDNKYTEKDVLGQLTNKE